METRLLQEHLWRAAARQPDKVALVDSRRRLTYGALQGEAAALAGFLVGEAGLQRGERVVLHLENSAEVAAGVYGTLAANAVFSPLSPMVKEAKLRYILGHCGARVLIGAAAKAELYARLLEALPELKTVVLVDEEGAGLPESGPSFVGWQQVMTCGAAAPAWRNIDIDLAALIYTSGSTGDPKGVMLTHGNLRNTSWAISTYLQNTPDDVIYCALPLSFDYGMYQVLTAVRVGARVVVRRGFGYPFAELTAMREEGATGFPGVPTIFALLLSLKKLGEVAPPTVRYLTNTAAALPPAHIRRLQAAFSGATIYSMYGLTECTRVTYLPPEELERRPGSVGRGMPNEEVWVEGGDGGRAAPGEVGELLIRGANVMRGYWDDDEATSRCLKTGRYPGEVVLRSGDLFKTDEEGFLYFVGRMDDIIKSRGEKVSPREVENVLHAHAGVREAAVIGVDHAVLGQAIKAFVVPIEGAELDVREVIGFCRERLEEYMVPRQVVVIDELPKTATGKVRKKDLR